MNCIMDDHVKKAAMSMLSMPPRNVPAQVDVSAAVFYKRYRDLHTPEVQSISKNDQPKRKKALNNITGRGGKLKKDWLVSIQRVLTDGLLERIAAAAASFLALLPSAPHHLRVRAEPVAVRIAAFIAEQAACAAAGINIHARILESARADGRRASQSVLARKIAEAAATSSPLSDVEVPSRSDIAFARKLAETVAVTPPPRDVQVPPRSKERVQTHAPEPLSFLDLPPSGAVDLSGAVATPMTPADADSPLAALRLESALALDRAPRSTAAAELDAALEPFSPADSSVRGSEFHLLPTMSALNSITASPEPVTPMSPTPESHMERRRAQTVRRKIKNTAAATRTNQTLRSLVVFYRAQVEKYAYFLADIEEMTQVLAVDNASGFASWLDETLLSQSHGAA